MANDTLAMTEERPRFHRENRKKNRGRKVADNQAQAIAKFLRVPPRKARLVIDEVRGKYALDALAYLRFIPNRAADFISKALQSAVANAVNNHELDLNSLKLIEARVDEGPRMKRVQPRAQGRAYRILKRTSHITIIVEAVEPKPKKAKKPAVAKSRVSPKTRVSTAPAETLIEETPVVPAVEEIRTTTQEEKTDLSEDSEGAPTPDHTPGFLDDPHSATLTDSAPAGAETK